MHVEGMENIHICAQDVQATLQVAISGELKESMLISCDDLCKLPIIPADFPNTVLLVKSNELLTRLKRKPLSDKLNPLPMNCDPMSIKLQPDTVPVCVTIARRVPKHFEPEYKKTIAEFIERQVIVPVDEPTTWCSPAFFVPKADGKRLRLAHSTKQVRTKTNASIPLHKGYNQGNISRGQAVLQIRCRTWEFPAIQQAHHIPDSTRMFPVSAS